MANKGGKPLTNEEVDKKLEGRSIRRKGIYVNARTKIEFECLVDGCDNTWFAKPSPIITGRTGCMKCYHRSMSFNNDVIDKFLENSNIRRLDDYVNKRIKLRFECMVCGYISKKFPILETIIGCKGCANTDPITNEYIDEKLANKTIKRLEDCKKYNKDKIYFRCTTCDYEWKARPSTIIDPNHSGKCPKCQKLARLNNNEIDKRLLGRNIKRIGNYAGKTVRIEFECEKCYCHWNTFISNVINSETGCPNCSRGKNERIVYETLTENGVVCERWKRISELFPNESNRMTVDFYIDEHKTIIEYNGGQHYRPVKFAHMIEYTDLEKQQKRDKYVQDLCDKNGIKLIWINGDKYTNSKLVKHIVDIILPSLKGVNDD